MADEPQEPVRRGGRPAPRRNVSEAENIAKTDEVLGKKEDRKESDLRHLMAQPEFRRYVWRKLNELKMWSDAIPLNSELYVQAAEKRVALRIWRELDDVAPNDLIQMMLDAKHHKEL